MIVFARKVDRRKNNQGNMRYQRLLKNILRSLLN